MPCSSLETAAQMTVQKVIPQPHIPLTLPEKRWGLFGSSSQVYQANRQHIVIGSFERFALFLIATSLRGTGYQPPRRARP